MAKNNKIGILTLQKVINYGGSLQSLALQTIIEKLGFQTEIININRTLKKSIYIKNKYGVIFQKIFDGYIFIRKIGTYILNVIVYRDILLRKQKRKKQLFYTFENSHHKFSNIEYTLNNIKNCQNNYSAIIVGSDQVWNHEFNFNIDPYYLEFINTETKRIAYAPSFGVNSIPHYLHERYSSWLLKFDFLSIREKEGKDLIKKISGQSASLVLDPTLLLSKEDWKTFIQINPIINYPYILCYTLSSENSLAMSICKKIANETGKQIIKIGNSKEDLKIKDTNILWEIGPQEFLSLILNASVVVTNSFHGTAFSVNFNKPFFCALNKENKRIGRIKDFLELLNLQNRILYNSEEINYELLQENSFNSNIDILIKEREKSIQFIQKALSSI